MRRASRGLDTPARTIGQEVAAEKVFDEFLSSMGLSKVDLDRIHNAHNWLSFSIKLSQYMIASSCEYDF
ncbi:Hypothetical protein PHPALM_37006 [Phytophthora palmivora]|uniref:Uncharacterized protein n=1 Tax=Phytophthora palmivora TaxID=4796 RepID=A0A2P4WYH0_9STRA|nr:Hypothetical protein PHPALM_37006 [Phytophthora palmivora]